MTQNNHSLLAETEEICDRVQEVVRTFPDAINVAPEEFFQPSNLWKIEVDSSCNQVVEHYRSIRKLAELGLYRPAAALSRNIHECCIRFIYLASHEDELEDWFEWQLSQEFHFNCDRLAYDEGLRWDAKEELLQDKRRIQELLGHEPTSKKSEWKSTSDMLRDIVKDESPGTEKKLRRYLIGYPSTYVHFRVSAQPDPNLILGTTIESALGFLREAMNLSYSKALAGPTAVEIAGQCDRIRDSLSDNRMST